MIGILGCSLAGHDQGTIYYIVDENEKFFWVCDGKIKPLEKPKKKNKKHMQVIKLDLCEKPFEINSDLLTNEKIKRTIKLYSKDI